MTAVEGMKRVKSDLGAYARKKDRAMDTAVKVEAFRLMRGLKSGIRSGSPGGRALAPLSALSRYRDGRFRGPKPFRGMAAAVKYGYDPRSQVARIGWTPATSERLRRIARRYQEGFETPVTDAQRRMFAHRGKGLGERSRLRKYFFLKKTTTGMKTPEREIVAPFYTSEKSEIKRNIDRNFRMKMKGQRL